MIRRLVPVFLSFVILAAPTAFALRYEQVGPIKGKAIAQPGWPSGMAGLVGHSSRVYSTGRNAENPFYFKSNPKEISELVKFYSELRMREHQVFIKKTPKEVTTFGGVKVKYNVNLYFLYGYGLMLQRMKGSGETYDPTLTIYVEDKETEAAVRKIEIPDHVIVTSEIEGWPKSKAKKQLRKAWHAAIQFRNGTPATDFKGNAYTRVTLWEAGNRVGIDLGGLAAEAKFTGAFSKKEMTKFKNKDAWLTLTVGNQMTKAKGTDTLLPVDFLFPNAEEVKPFQVSRPRYYYGRVLFQDGLPAHLEGKGWKGSQIAVNFPYAGLSDVDKEGYFKIVFTAEQLKQLKGRKERPNVYIPDVEDPLSRKALYVFPVHKLSAEKEKAGTIKIEAPGRREDVG